MISDRQVKGIIAVAIILAFIPFIYFLYDYRIDSKYPVFSTSGSENLTIEIAEENGTSGIFFVQPGMTARQLFASLGSNRIFTEDFKLENAMKIRLGAKGDRRTAFLEKIEADKRLSLGLPIDINLAGHDELVLIPGIGEVLAGNIVAYRNQTGRFETLEQLMEVKGIKEKKLSKLRRHLYVDKTAGQGL